NLTGCTGTRHIGNLIATAQLRRPGMKRGTYNELRARQNGDTRGFLVENGSGSNQQPFVRIALCQSADNVVRSRYGKGDFDRSHTTFHASAGNPVGIVGR